MRRGRRPRQCITTTPKPVPLLRALLKRDDVVITRGKTSDNAANLAKPFLDSITSRYAGTRLGRQELSAEILDDLPGALPSAAAPISGGLFTTTKPARSIWLDKPPRHRTRPDC